MHFTLAKRIVLIIKNKVLVNGSTLHLNVLLYAFRFVGISDNSFPTVAFFFFFFFRAERRLVFANWRPN